MASTTTKGNVEQLERALSSITRRGTRRRLHDHIVEEAGVEIDRAAYLVLRELEAVGPIRVTELATKLSVDPSTMSRHISALQRRGWIERTPDPADGRATLVAVSRTGARTIRRVEAGRRNILTAVLSQWDGEDQAALVALMTRFGNDLSGYVDGHCT